MEPQEVTFDDVAEAAENLQDEGKRVSIEAVSGILGNAPLGEIQKHLAEWRAVHAGPVEMPKVEIPQTVAAALESWVKQYAKDAGAGSRAALAQAESELDAMAVSGAQLEAARAELADEVAALTAARDDARALAAERAEQIERLNAELRNARQIATDALVSKAKDQLAIDGKDLQLADLRAQIERNVAASAAESDRRLAAEMELVGAVTARDSFEAEVRELRAQLESCFNERRSAAGVKS
ncbi:DNA-binding protein [Massilia sp. SM-13]